MHSVIFTYHHLTSPKSHPTLHIFTPDKRQSQAFQSHSMAKLQFSLFFIFLSLISFPCYRSQGIDDDPVEESLEWLEQGDGEVDVAHSGGETGRRACNLSVGKWVYDRSYPLYGATCPYLSQQVSCKKNGRPDSEYQRWRWRPQECSLSRFTTLTHYA